MSVSTYDKYNSLRDFLKTGQRSIEDCVLHMGQNKRTIYRALKVLRSEPGFRTIRGKGGTRFAMEDASLNAKISIIQSLENITKKSSGSASEERLVASIQRLISSIQKNNGTTALEAFPTHDDFIIDLGPQTDCNFNNEALKKKIEKCLQSIRNHQKIKIQYTRTQNSLTETFIIKPVKLIMRIDTLYLWGAHEINGEESMRLFVFNQISRFTYLSETFKPIKENPATLYQYSFAKWIPDTKELPPTQIVLEATADWSAQIFKRFHFQNNNDFASSTQKKTKLELYLSITPDFKSWLFGMLDAVKIIKPLSLKREAQKYLEESLKALK